MTKPVGFGAMLAAFVVGLVAAHGCVDDRARVANGVFFCDPSSRSADADCGKGFVCYGAAQAVGRSICVPKCDPATPSTCDGVCTVAGACLARCTVPLTHGAADGCPSPLICRRRTIAAVEAAAGNDGLCLPVNASCTSSADCTSPVFNECTSVVNGANQGPRLLSSGEVCVQGKCSERGIACEPGSACVRDVLPPTIPAPDVCSPICSALRQRGDGGVFNECLPGLTCLSDAFPQTDAPACAPGFPGWLCVDDIGCTAGRCYDWGDVAPGFAGFKTCAAACKSDDDCVPFDRQSNPTFVSRNTCHEDGVCRNLTSMLFTLTCLRDGDVCQLDPEARCTGANPDLGTGGATNGLGAFGGQAALCLHGCGSREDCAPLASKLHVPMTCLGVAPLKACMPIVPFVTDCIDDRDCFGDLTCESPLQGRKVCTRRCGSSTDCLQDPALGSTFACEANLCVPKIESGGSAPIADQCISGQLLGGKCVSPTGWSCTADSQCANGQCVLIANTSPAFGRCN